jgi:ribosomal protein L35AE/L33A
LNLINLLLLEQLVLQKVKSTQHPHYEMRKRVEMRERREDSMISNHIVIFELRSEDSIVKDLIVREHPEPNVKASYNSPLHDSD